MEAIQKKAGIVSTVLLAIINGLAGLGIVPPQGFDAEGVALLNGAVLAIGALAVHMLGKREAEAPGEPE